MSYRYKSVFTSNKMLWSKKVCIIQKLERYLSINTDKVTKTSAKTYCRRTWIDSISFFITWIFICFILSIDWFNKGLKWKTLKFILLILLIKLRAKVIKTTFLLEFYRKWMYNLKSFWDYLPSKAMF